MIIKLFRHKIIFFICLIIGLFIITACQKDSVNDTIQETVRYQHVTGYEVSIPKDWTLLKQTETGGVYFISPGKNVSLNIMAEVGGMNYLNPQELSNSVYQELEGIIDNAKIIKIEAVQNKEHEYRQLIEGTDQAGNNVYADTYLYQPMDGMRYYLILCCGGDDYAVTKSVYDNIINSFQITKGQDEIFSLLTLDEQTLREKLSHGLETDFSE